eukprot:scaffold118410_cov43-Phaeocystis_antarctica.AAC.2
MEGEVVSNSISFHLRRLSSRRSSATDTSSSNRTPGKVSNLSPNPNPNPNRNPNPKQSRQSLGETEAPWKHAQRKDEKEDTCAPALAE